MSLLGGLASGDEDVVSERVAWYRVEAGETVFRRDDESDHLYIVGRGRLRVLDADGGTISEVGPGEAVGELGVVTGARRVATVRAVRDSLVASVDRALLRDLIVADPDRAFSLAGLVASRVRSSGPTHDVPAPRVITILDTQQTGSAAPLAADLADRLEDTHLLATEHMGPADVAEAIDRRERSGTRVLLVPDPASPDLARAATRQADLVLMSVGPGCRPPTRSSIAEPIEDLLDRLHLAEVRPRIEVVLHHGPTGPAPGSTAAWKRLLGAEGHHHLDGTEATLDRMARRLSGTGVAVVFSGGGARAMSHLGVLTALAEAGVPVDAVGGTSMGALVATAVALRAPGLDPSAVGELTADVRREMTALDLSRRLTVPVVSLLSVQRARQVYERLLGDRELEDAWLPCFVTTVDLSACTATTIERGSAALWARASASAPGMWPAVIDDDGHLHVDGGIVDNLPVPRMRERWVGPVVAVNVSNRMPMAVPPATPQIDGPLDLLRTRITSRVGRDVPTLGRILGRTAVVTSLGAQEAAAAMADLVLEPDVAGIGLVEYSAFDEAVAAGRRAADERRDELTRLLPAAG